MQLAGTLVYVASSMPILLFSFTELVDGDLFWGGYALCGFVAISLAFMMMPRPQDGYTE